MRTFRWIWMPLFAVAVLCSSPGCASAIPFLGKKAGKVAVTVEGAPDCNNCRTKAASSLKLRIFQVADSSAIRSVLNNKTISWSKQMEKAADNLLGKPAEEFVGPGITKSVVVERDPKAVAVVIQGNFCEKTGADWYFIHPAKKKAVKLIAGSTGFTLTTGK